MYPYDYVSDQVTYNFFFSTPFRHWQHIVQGTSLQTWTLSNDDRAFSYKLRIANKKKRNKNKTEKTFSKYLAANFDIYIPKRERIFLKDFCYSLHYEPEWKFWLGFWLGEILLTYMIFAYHWTS